MIKKFRVLEVFGIFLSVFLALLVFTYPKEEFPHDKIIVAFGDSLTRGYGTPPGKNFVSYLSEYIKTDIINSGHTGDTTADALVRLEQDVLNYHPNIVLVLLGGNDFFDGNSEEVVRVNLKTIIKKIHESGAKVILIGGSKKILPNYETVFAKIASEEKVEGYVPDVLRAILFRKDLLFDEVHPNTRGHEVIAQLILPVLEKVLRQK